MVALPHFDVPLRFGPNNRLVVVQQDSDDDVANCVAAALRTTRGNRLYVPNFGIDDPTFEDQPIDLNLMVAQVVESEPRAQNLTAEQIMDELEVDVTIGVQGVE